ncbi:MAG: pitrilysin family protein [Ketobacteraceae bacterium]|nr:pitrilysin family protein [Ketobacteraceae bacterium]
MTEVTPGKYLLHALLACFLTLTSLAANGSETGSDPGGDTLSPAERTFETRLDNGMKIIVREDHRAPVMVSQVWYKVGSSYEPIGMTGVSHVLEHMMFKGTDKVPPGEFSKIVAKYGGSENAFTSYDYTGYYQMMQANNLALSFELEADRMRNALLPEDEFAKEVEVVKEERRLRIVDNPNSRTYERFMAAAYLSSGYHHPIIGWMHDLDNLTIDNIRYWYETWYAPNNAILVVVGDVDHEEVFQLAERFFGPLQPSQLPRPPSNREVAPLGERRVEVRVPAQLPALYMGYNVPGINTAEEEWEVYALRMLAGVLDGGYSARIETDIIRKQKIAAGASAGYGGFSLGDTLFYLTGTPANGHTLAELETALIEQVTRLQSEPPGKEEMQRVKAQVISDIVFQQDSISSQANQIGRMEAIGRSWKEMDHYVEKLSTITPEQVQAVAIKYLVPARKTVAQLIPGS